MPDRYRHNNGSVTSISYHVIWIPRRRRKALVGDVAKQLIALLREKAAEIDVTIMHLAVQAIIQEHSRAVEGRHIGPYRLHRKQMHCRRCMRRETNCPSSRWAI